MTSSEQLYCEHSRLVSQKLVPLAERLISLIGPSIELAEYLIMCNGIYNTRPCHKHAKQELGYIERHHVVPRSFDKSLVKDKNNIIACTAYEHYELHRLLMQAAKNNFYLHYKARRAFSCFAMRRDGRQVLTAEQYEAARRERCTFHSPEVRAKMGKQSAGNKYWVGRKHTTESIEKMRASHSGIKLSKETIAKRSETRLANQAAGKKTNRKKIGAIQQQKLNLKRAETFEQRTANRWGYNSYDDVARAAAELKNQGKSNLSISKILGVPETSLRRIAKVC